MTPARFRAIMSALGWTARGLARRLSYNEATIRKTWPGAMPESVGPWLERVARPLEAHPLPEGWRTQKRGPGRPPHRDAA